MSQLVGVVFTPAEQKLEATVEDVNGKIRRITVMWRGKDPLPIPTNWFAQVEAEVADRIGAEHAKSIGRVLLGQ